MTTAMVLVFPVTATARKRETPMKQSWIDKVKEFLHNPIPQRVKTPVSTFWLWRCHVYGVKQK